jgi:amidase
MINPVLGQANNYFKGGSIRIPASLCGLVGFKATHGLVPYTGCVSNEATIDFVGPITRNCLDNALLLEVIAGVDGLVKPPFCFRQAYH